MTGSLKITMKRRNIKLNILSAKSTRLILVASLLSLCVIVAAAWVQGTQPLPATPTLAYQQVIEAMLKKNKWYLWRISTLGVVNELASFQGEKAVENCAYDFLTAKGIEPELLKQPWGLWQQWAKQVEMKKIKAFVYDDTWSIQRPPPQRCAITSGNPDGVTLHFEKRPNGWLLVKVVTQLGANSVH